LPPDHRAVNGFGSPWAPEPSPAVLAIAAACPNTALVEAVIAAAGPASSGARTGEVTSPEASW
jgi:hypothetical protein